MKKYLSVILEIILTACLVACGSSNKDSVNDDKQEDFAVLTNIQQQVETMLECVLVVQQPIQTMPEI